MITGLSVRGHAGAPRPVTVAEEAIMFGPSEKQLTDLNLAPAPRADPALYPGERLAFDYLLRDDRVRPLAPGVDGWPDGQDDRTAVVAFGSNAAPAQLVAKFGGHGGPIAVTRARLRGCLLAHSAHVSDPGYLPWVLVDEPGAAVDCAVLWLDEPQRAQLDVTEPNYELVPVHADRYLLQLAAVETPVRAPIQAAVYRGRWGALRWPDADRPLPAGSQRQLFERLAALGWFRNMVGSGPLRERQARLAGDAALRDRMRDELAERGMTVPDGWQVG